MHTLFSSSSGIEGLIEKGKKKYQEEEEADREEQKEREDKRENLIGRMRKEELIEKDELGGESGGERK